MFGDIVHSPSSGQLSYSIKISDAGKIVYSSPERRLWIYCFLDRDYLENDSGQSYFVSAVITTSYAAVFDIFPKDIRFTAGNEETKSISVLLSQQSEGRLEAGKTVGATFVTQVGNSGVVKSTRHQLELGANPIQVSVTIGADGEVLGITAG